MYELALRGNVYCKLSGMVTEADWQNWTVGDLRPYTDVVLSAFGPKRLMFGSDWPVCTLAAQYDEVIGVIRTAIDGRPQSEQDSIFGGTARRFWNL